jgi:hypothetical protein
MDDNQLLFIFTSVLSMQYHPRNNVLPEDDVVVIQRCLQIAEKANTAFSNHFNSDHIPF